MKEIITIRVSKFLSDELAKKVAQMRWGTSAPQYVNCVRQAVFDELADGNDCFEVVAATSNGEVVGSLHCVRNEADFSLWYYGDLFVMPEYRRIGIARQMTDTAIRSLSEMGAAVLRCYVDPDNMPSRNLQCSVGFEEKPFEAFNSFDNDGEIMYEIRIPDCLCVIPATVNEACFVRIMFAQNKGVGTFALHFAEQYAKENGFDFIAASVDKDNTAAEKCFLKCGYTASEQNSVTEFRKAL